VTAARSATRRWAAGLVAVVGAALIVASLLASFWPRVGGDPVPTSWSGETLYLRADGRQDEQCTVSPSTGRTRTVTVPGSPGRGLKLVGTRLEPWFDGEATITCPSPVTATRGPILLVYPLAENDPWVIIPAVVLLVVGFVLSRPRRT